MLKKNLLLAFRNFGKQRLQTIINVMGLAVGISGALVVYVGLHYELNFDNFHSSSQELYRVVQHNHTADEVQHWNTTAYPLAAALRDDFPDLEVTQAAGPVSRIIHSEETPGVIRRFKQERILFADPYYLRLFDFRDAYATGGLWLAGNPETAFAQPSSVILTESLVERYFPEALKSGLSVIGKTLLLNNKDQLTVTGVVRNPPGNTNLLFEMLIPFEFFRVNNPYFAQNWSGNYQGTTYITLPENQAPEEVERRIATWQKTYLSPEDDRRIEYHLQALSDIHVNTRYGNAIGSYNSSRKSLAVLAAMAVFLLLIACVNFINLATARTARRSLEVGVRKVLGSTRRQLIQQFLSETFMLALLSTLLALMATEISIHQLNLLFSELHLQLQLGRTVFVAGALLMLLVTLLAGLYPALLFSGLSPAKSLKSRFLSNDRSGLGLRRGLIMLQFGIAHLFIVGTIIAARQMDYFQQMNLGFTKEAIVTVKVPGSSWQTLNSLEQRFLQHPDIESVSFASGPPLTGFQETSYGTTFRFRGEPEAMQRKAEMKVVDPNYFDLFNLEIIAGKPLTQANITEEQFNGFVVNEALIKSLGLEAEEALGTAITINEGEAPIIGVVKDFHNNPLQEAVTPCLMFSWYPGFLEDAHIRMRAREGAALNVREVLSFVEAGWRETFPDGIYQYSFLDEKFARNYIVENLTYRAFQLFALLAILISSLGLYGLITFIAEARTKEIGVRRVLGASVTSIMALLSKDLLKPVLLSIFLATPLAWYLMNNWLSNFANRIEPQWWMFAAAGLLAVLITLVTMSTQSAKAALANPVEALKSE